MIDDRQNLQKNMKNIINSNRCFLIAEIGVNHNGDIDLAKNMI